MKAETRLVFSRATFPKGEACLVFDRFEATGSRRIVWKVLGETLTLKSASELYCTGRYELSTFESFPCPDAAKVLDGKSATCYACFQFNAFNPSFYNLPVTALSHKQRLYNSQPHVVYLAAFGPGMVKVGISHHQRIYDRWCEQGALAAAIIGRAPDAYTAREMEVWCGDKAKLPEQVNKNRKIEMLSKSFVIEELKENILSVYRQLGSDAKNRGLKLEDIQDLNLRFFGNFPIRNLEPLPQQKEELISGLCRGLIGSLIILENEGRKLICSLTPLVGHAVNLSKNLSGLELNTFQPSLF